MRSHASYGLGSTHERAARRDSATSFNVIIAPIIALAGFAATDCKVKTYKETMAKFVFLIIVSLCGLLQTNALGFGKLAKRQTCDSSSLPMECQSILSLTIEGAAYSDPTNFVGSYCSATCAEPLYEYFRDCDIGSDNATKFDLFCSSNAAGDRCVPAVANYMEANAENSVFSVCNFTGEATCTQECANALALASDSLGCCFFSYYAALAGPLAATALFRFCGQDRTVLCVGGVTGGIPTFPVENIDPECADLVDDVDQSCHLYLGGDISELLYIHDIEDICSGTCGPQVYQFRQECGKRTGYDNSTALDVVCAKNLNGKRCGAVFENVLSFNFSTCDGIDGFNCPAECRDALTSTLEPLGCCFRSLYQLLSEDSDLDAYADLFSILCEVNLQGNCDGAFSGEPAPPPVIEDQCDFLQLELPAECRRYSNIEVLSIQAYINSTETIKFCDGPCSKPVYNYFVNCDRTRGGNNATYLDFLCSENDNGDRCAKLFADTGLFDVLDKNCEETTDTFCSQDCSEGLKMPFQMWGCCLFTFGAIDDNVTYVTGIVDQCNLVGKAEVCIGGLSDKPIDAPGQQMTDDPTVCNKLADAISTDCQRVSTYELVLSSAFIDPGNFLEDFCDSECATPVYAYINECVNKTKAAFIDFLCSESSSGTDCSNILADSELENAIDGVCKDATDKQCSQDCKDEFQGFSKDYGCCLFTYSALDTNVSFSRGLWNQCEGDNAGLCTGGISNAAVKAPGSEVEDAALNTAVSSILVVATALLLSTLV